MWMTDDEIEYYKARSKFISGAGCFIAVAVVILILIVSVFSFASKVLDLMEPKDRQLFVSKSPDQTHAIKVIEKGRGLSFADPTVLISYKKYKIERQLNNDRKDLAADNVSINWNNNEEATVILYGDEQYPRVIQFKVPEKGEYPFQVIKEDLDIITLLSRQSPNHVNVVELRRKRSLGMPYANNPPVEVYYGKIGSSLQKYDAPYADQQHRMDFFEIIWHDDQHATIHAKQHLGKGSTRLVSTLEITLN
ncbi:hypothetical protein [Bacillus sp. T33-2]|uniref:hypothetical protein n=1 Tax=Bacillus sp. T33-2 TaxID=2054168 RepID=UPI000C78CECE|nr:hypothetical protein [Bacillus sp. T33-2]PLR94624.1 hypothetical protein CVD19_16785 [Bacillus sp. T33-2]